MKQYMIIFKNKEGKRVYLYANEECFEDAYRVAKKLPTSAQRFRTYNNKRTYIA